MTDDIDISDLVHGSNKSSSDSPYVYLRHWKTVVIFV